MNDKAQLVMMLRQEFNEWEDLLGQLDEAQITAPVQPNGLSIKDVIAHLWGWQQRSIARMEASIHDTEPDFDLFPAGLDTEIEDDVDKINAWIDETYKDKPWSEIYQNWKDEYIRFIALADVVPEENLFDETKYSWIEGYPLARVLEGSYEHHRDDHRLPLLDWLREQGMIGADE